MRNAAEDRTLALIAAALIAAVVAVVLLWPAPTTRCVYQFTRAHDTLVSCQRR